MSHSAIQQILTWLQEAAYAYRLPLAALAVAVACSGLIRRARRYAALLVVCGYFTALHAVFVPVGRHSEPLYPMLAILIAAASATMNISSS